MSELELILPEFLIKDEIEIVEVSKDISLEEQVVNSIKRDLERLNWKFKLPNKKNSYPTFVPPENYDKETIKNSMSFKRNEIILKEILN